MLVIDSRELDGVATTSLLKVKAFGTLEIRNGDRWKRISSKQERFLLACLLLDPDQVVPVDQLVDSLWANLSPVRPHKVLGTYISRLRRRLADAELSIENHGGGYQLKIAPDQFDLQIFEKGCAEGLSAFQDGQLDRAAKVLTSALSLWRAAPFSDVTSLGGIHIAVDHLSEMRLSAMEVRTHALMIESVAASNFEAVDALIPQLRRHIAKSPFRERFWCLLMQALYLAGRPAESIQAYLACRSTLVDELGLEPGFELRTVYEEILTGSFDVDKLWRRPVPARK